MWRGNWFRIPGTMRTSLFPHEERRRLIPYHVLSPRDALLKQDRPRRNNYFYYKVPGQEERAKEPTTAYP